MSLSLPCHHHHALSSLRKCSRSPSLYGSARLWVLSAHAPRGWRGRTKDGRPFCFLCPIASQHCIACRPSVRPRRPSPSRLSPTRRRDGGISLTTFGNWYSASIRRNRNGDKITSRVDQEPGGSPTPQKAPSPFVSLLCWPFGLAPPFPSLPFPSPPETRNCAAARS